MESFGNHRQSEMPFLGLVKPPVLVSPVIVSVLSDVGALRLAVQESGHDDYEIADAIAISPGYMSKVLKGTAGLYGKRLVAFMRETRHIGVLQVLAHEMGCEVVVMDSQAARIAALKAEVARLEGRAA